MKIEQLNKKVRTFKETYIFLKEKLEEMYSDKYRTEAKKHIRFTYSNNINFNITDFQFIKKTYKQDIKDFNLTTKDKKNHRFFNISFDVIFDRTEKNIEKFKQIGKEIEEFLEFDNSTTNSYIPSYYLYTISPLQQGKETEDLYQFSFKTKTNTQKDINYSLLLRTTEELNKENIIYMIKNFKTNNTNNMKLSKEVLFGTINSKLYNELIEELEKENKIIVKRTPKLIIKSLEINNNTNVVENSEVLKKLEIMQKLESNGKLKCIQKPTNYKKEYIYELYNFHLFQHLKTYLIFDIITNKYKLKINYFAMKYAKNIMQDLGIWQEFKNSLNEKFLGKEKKLKTIEDFLDINIILLKNNKEKITPFKYIDNKNGETEFISKDFDIEIRKSN